MCDPCLVFLGTFNCWCFPGLPSDSSFSLQTSLPSFKSFPNMLDTTSSKLVKGVGTRRAPPLEVSPSAVMAHCSSRRKPEFRTSEIAHYLCSFLAVRNLGVGKWGEEEASHSKNDSFHNRSIQNVPLHFIAENDSLLPHPLLWGAAEAVLLDLVVVSLRVCWSVP